MMRGKLEQLTSLRAEIVETKARINMLQQRGMGAATDRKLEILKELQEKCEELEIEIMEWVNGIDDSRVRRAVVLYYVDGYSWRVVADMMNYEKSTPQKFVARYLERN